MVFAHTELVSCTLQGKDTTAQEAVNAALIMKSFLHGQRQMVLLICSTRLSFLHHKIKLMGWFNRGHSILIAALMMVHPYSIQLHQQVFNTESILKCMYWTLCVRKGREAGC